MTVHMFGEGGLDIDGLLDRLARKDAAVQEITHQSNLALKGAKRSMFALQRRGAVDEARAQLEETRDVLGHMQLRFPANKVRRSCGPWRVAVEEFLEALYFFQFMNETPLDSDNDPLVHFQLEDGSGQLHFEDAAIFGALSDLTGEIGRQIQMWIRDDQYDQAIAGNQAIATIVEHLNRNTSGGHLRKKVDQANGNLGRSDGRITDLKVRGLI